MSQFVRVGDYVFNVRAINAVSLNNPDDLHIFTSDCNGSDTQGYVLDRNEPETQAFIVWLTDPDRCTDVMAHQTSVGRTE